MTSSFKEFITEADKALTKKSEKSGISYGVLKKVYDRGVAAWRTGHRPGTNSSTMGICTSKCIHSQKEKRWSEPR